MIAAAGTEQLHTTLLSFQVNEAQPNEMEVFLENVTYVIDAGRGGPKLKPLRVIKLPPNKGARVGKIEVMLGLSKENPGSPCCEGKVQSWAAKATV